MCYIKIKVSCPHCRSSKVVKNGKKRTGIQNFLCKTCRKQFQYEYYYQGSDPKVKADIESSLLHGSGIKDCCKHYSVSTYTVLKVIEQEGRKIIANQIAAMKSKQQSHRITKQKHYSRVIIDELYSFVGSKRKKVWIFYAYAPETKEIIAFTMGKRSIKQLKSLMLKIKHLKISVDFFCTDGFRGFKKVLPYFQHLIGKVFTQPIEGVNTAIRAKIARFHRRTTKFSKKLKYQYYLFTLFIFYFNELPSYIS